MTQAPLVQLQGLTRDYAGNRLFGRAYTTRALEDVSMTVRTGTIFGIVGESGCGKSTLARIVMALDRPTGGKVLFDGDDLFSLTPAALKRKRRDFQMVFQDPFGSLDPRHTVGRIVAEPLHVLETRPSKTERRDRVIAMLESVGLDADAAGRYPHQFSGGQRQRIAIARALITGPKLVVADEAVSALDLSVQAQVLNLLMDLRDRRGVTVLFISHNLGVIDSIADEVGVMYRGRLVETGPAHAVFEAPCHPYTKLLTEAEPRIDVLGKAGRPAIAANPAPPASPEVGGCAFLPRCPMATARCVAERPELRIVSPGRLSACHHAESMPDPWPAETGRPTRQDALNT